VGTLGSRYVTIAGTLRPPEEVPVNLERLCKNLGVAVRVGDLPADTWGLTFLDTLVLINQALGDADARFALAHELGHLLCRRGAMPHVTADAEEWACDWFGAELLVPTRWLAQRLASDERRLSRQLGVPHQVLIIQKMSLGIGPAIRHLGKGGTACRSCGIRPHMTGCPCRRVRRLAQSAPPPDHSRVVASTLGGADDFLSVV